MKALVYIDAFVPDQGESVLDLASYPGAQQGDADLYVKLAIIYPPVAPIP